METVVQPARPEDAAQICTLMRGVIEASVECSLRHDILANVEANVAVWLRRPAECVHLVAVVDGSIVGVVLVKDFWNLCSLFVASALQGRGIGTVLVGAAIDQCAGRSPKIALLLNAYPNAVVFYERLGFMRRALHSSQSGIQTMELTFERRVA